MALEQFWDRNLITKYNQSGPRYTSYPTALEFNEQFTADDFNYFSKQYEKRNLSLYVHLPFCPKLCYFCACNKIITKHRHKIEHYLTYLSKEIIQKVPLFRNRLVTQIHLGGGTPTYLNKQQMANLVKLLKDNFNIAENAEIGIEIDPRNIQIEMIEYLKELGFNRLSIGVQDFDPKVQNAINRVQDEDFIAQIFSKAKKIGFQSSNMDLIYGLPNQSEQTFLSTLKKVVQIAPDRMSIFNYAHLPARFAGQLKIDENLLPSAETKLNILQIAIEYLISNGYCFIGMDHFAKPSDELTQAQQNGTLQRNFQGYTTQKDCDLLGLGVSAISALGDSFSQNHKDLLDYYRAVEDDINPLAKGFKLNFDDCIRRDVIKSLICNFRLEFQEIEQRYQIDFKTYFAEDLQLLKNLELDNLVTIYSQEIVVNSLGRLLIRNICMCFDIYSRHIARRQAFSRII